MGPHGPPCDYGPREKVPGVPPSPGLNRCVLSTFLDASSHLYKRPCPSVGWLVGWLVRPSVTLSFFGLLGATNTVYTIQPLYLFFSEKEIWRFGAKSSNSIAPLEKVKNLDLVNILSWSYQTSLAIECVAFVTVLIIIIFRCVLASLYEAFSVHPSVRGSVR